MDNQNSNMDNLNNLSNGMNIPQNNVVNNGMNISQNNVVNNEMNIPQNNVVNNGMNIPQNNVVSNGMNISQNNVVNNGMNISQNNVVNNEMNISQNNVVNNGMNSMLKNNKKIIFIFVLIIVVIIVIFIVFSLLKLKNNFENNSNDNVIEEDFSGVDSDYDEDKYTSSTSFFFQNDDKTYTLYDENGNKLSNENFKYVSGFINGVSTVETEDKKSGLIKDDGTMLIDYEKNVKVSNIGAFFKVDYEDSNDYSTYTKIYDSNGKVIKEGEQIFGRNLVSDYHRVSMISDLDNHYIYNYNGELVATIPAIEEYSEIRANTNGSSYLLIYYNNKSYIINTNSKLLFTLDNEFYISDVSEDGSRFLLLPYNEYSGNTNKFHYKLVKNGKIISEFETDEALYFKGNILKGDYQLYDENGNIMNTGIYFDENNYVLKNEKNKYDLYENGILKTTLNCNYTNFNIAKKGFYIMENCDNQIGKTFYNLDGSKLNDIEFKSAREFDDYGLAIVSYDNENYFLINTKGEKISNEYDEIELVYRYQVLTVSTDHNEDVYIATKDNEKILLNTDGKELISGDEIKINYKFAIVQRDGKYEIFNIEKNKSITVLDFKPTIYQNYFTYEDNGKTLYCAYGSGNPFFEEQV